MDVASAVAADASGLKRSERITLPISAMLALARVEHPRNGAAQIRQPPGPAGRGNRRGGSA
ncbi:hypothetical protein [Ralstonia pseudosolanacearum]|uniref:hypothetical protein n=1 Tax=Ralstonia pseudosolanacearum TaxID=1310165 RepID=UPI002675CD50|nr:hypothetical protein [Ralstonia pseudosolanacearum]MDO3561129.1 hypothetical protein [Ralstonia pseudosolanacearum]MDO3571014.1 hypothetical protein [Ralstonia pseudosolanacearum]